jgi:hypothetical protein
MPVTTIMEGTTIAMFADPAGNITGLRKAQLASLHVGSLVVTALTMSDGFYRVCRRQPTAFGYRRRSAQRVEVLCDERNQKTAPPLPSISPERVRRSSLWGALSDRSAAAPLAAVLIHHFTAVAFDRRGEATVATRRPGGRARGRRHRRLIKATGGSAFAFGHSLVRPALEAVAAGFAIAAGVVRATTIVDDSRPPPKDYGRG